MEEKIFNNLLHGYPFYFPFWRAPFDEQCTLEEAIASKNIWIPALHFGASGSNL